MSIWEAEVFGSDSVIELFDEAQNLGSQGRVGVLVDASHIGADSESSDERVYVLVVTMTIAIWNGAPSSDGGIVKDYSFIRGGILEAHGSKEDVLATAPEVFGSPPEKLGESDQAAPENYAEAVE